MMMAARHPEIWAGVSAWVGISDLAKWHGHCAATKEHCGYAAHIEKVCGGKPGESPAVDAELKTRSPLTWLKPGMPFPLQINAGIHDGHTGSVPISQSFEAFNAVAAPQDKVAKEDIDIMPRDEIVPAHLRHDWNDPAFGRFTVLFRKTSGNVTINIFEGGHEMVHSALQAFLEANA